MWSDTPSPRYHPHLISENHDLLDTVLFAYELSFRKGADPNPTPFPMFGIPVLSVKAKKGATAGSTTGQVGEVLQDEGFVTKYLDAESG